MKVSGFTQKFGLLPVLILGLTLLAACGATPAPSQVDNNFTVPPYTGATEVTALENSSDFKSKVLVNDVNTGPEEVKIFSTSASLADVKTFYTTQMKNLGWGDATARIIDPTALGTDAWVMGYEKATSQTPPVNHVAGLYMFSATSAALTPYKNLLPAGNQNILMQITGSSVPGTPTPAK